VHTFSSSFWIGIPGVLFGKFTVLTIPSRFWVTNPVVFFGGGAIVIGYVLCLVLRKPRRSRSSESENDL
jgi:hypothetical protein